MQTKPISELSLLIRQEQPSDDPAVERLHERAFGPGRLARTAFRLREGASHNLNLSFVAFVGNLLVGSIRLTPVQVETSQALMLGPLTVEPAFMNRGMGTSLINRALQAAREAQHLLVLLVGDAPYYSRFGFQPVPRGHLVLPGPVDPKRFLALELEEGVLATSKGKVMPFQV